MRVTGGQAKGRKLKAVPPSGVRPTGARVRAAIFNMVGQDLEGVRVLDLFAGVGTLGIEALSRGAAHVVFVERSPRALKGLRSNLDAAGFRGRATIVSEAVGRSAFAAAPGERFDLVLADPPYKDAGDVGYLVALLEADLVTPRARIVVEHGTRVVPPGQVGPLVLFARRRYGDTTVSIYGKSDGKSQGEKV